MINSISAAGASSYTPKTGRTDSAKGAENASGKANGQAAADSKVQTGASEGVVYEKSDDSKVNTDSAKQIYDKDTIIKKLKADQQAHIESMQNLVYQLLTKQGAASTAANGNGQGNGIFDLTNIAAGFDLTKATNLADTFRAAAQNADEETVKKAKESISEDGYYGVKKTSDRLASMAIALTGNDPSKADEMLEALKKGFEKATAAWGEELPQISKDTYDAAVKKINEWKAGKAGPDDFADNKTEDPAKTTA
ncbi:MAG: hypothetical protein VZR00_00185 [Lachnospiraceae bacterium]|jgi:hypothetical protein|nr:hypothetical protein [Lachnospiraceae bacterium]MEE3460295.1 hypothetical protein [Lachnospiraceae bacterium]